MTALKRILPLSLILFYSSIGLRGICFSQVTPGQIERSQEIIQNEEALRSRVGQESKVLIKKIIVQGANLLTTDEIKKLTLAYENHWLSKSDINEIIDLLKAAYKQKGYDNQPVETSFRIKKGYLKIRIKEAVEKIQ